MQKTPELFDLWNEKQKNIEFGNTKKKHADVGEIRWYREGINIGNEISKGGHFLRPCIILHANIGSGLYFILPLTTKYNRRNKNMLLPINPMRTNKQSWGVMNTIKYISYKRLAYPMHHKRMKTYQIKGLLSSYIIFLTNKKLPHEEEVSGHEKNTTILISPTRDDESPQ